LRLLILTPQLPYPPHQGPTKGTTIRNYGLIAGLAPRHEIHLLSFVTPEDDAASVRPLQDACEAVHTVLEPQRTRGQRVRTTLTSRLPDMAHRLASPAFESALRKILAGGRFDVVQFEAIEMSPYLATVLDCARRAARPPRLIFDEHNAEYVLQKRVFETDIRVPSRWPGAVYSFLQWQKLRGFEAWACRQVDAVAAVSDVDARSLQRLVPGLQVAVVPNGIDVAMHAAYTARYAVHRAPKDVLPIHSLVFTGTMDYRPNVDAALWFASRVYPLIQESVPDVHFCIVGRQPHPRLDPLREQRGIVITGDVPDTRPYIAGADVYVIPLRSGGGTRFKVLEAMTLHRPIVSTTMGCDGFPVVSGREVILADEPDAFAREVVELLRDGDKRAALGQAGFDFASAHYDWSAIVPLLEATYAPTSRS
jgi:glycosyltransferase involved in cell wall biosynthesis